VPAWSDYTGAGRRLQSLAQAAHEGIGRLVVEVGDLLDDVGLLGLAQLGIHGQSQ